MGNRNILQDFPSYMLSKEAPDIDEILNNYDDLKKKVQVLQNITTGVFQYQGSRSLKVLVDDIKAYLANGGDNKYSKGCFYNINDLTGFDIKGLTVGDNIVFTGTIVTYSDEIPVSYNSQTGIGNICGFEFDRFPSVVDLSEYLKTADADTKYALISDLNNIVTEMENSIIQGGNIDSLTLDVPITDTSRINKIYNVARGNWNGVRDEAGGYHRFNYNCTMTNAKIINDNGSYYIQCGVGDIPTELYSRPLGNFALNDELSTFDIVIDSYIYTFEYTSYSGDPPSEILKFSLKNVQYGPDFSDDYYAQKFVDNIYDLGDIATVWAVDINVGDNFVITKNGFDSLVGNYATSGELNDLQRKLDTINKTLSGVYKNGGDVSEMTLDVPVPSGKINTMYNVKSGFCPSSGYGEHGAFKYKITIKNAYILKTTSDSGNTYELCFKLGDIPSELWYYSIGMVTFYGKFRNTIDYQPTDISGCFEFTSPSELSIQMSQEGLEYIVKLPYEVSYNAPPIDYYFSDKTFTDNKYQLGNITTIWYRKDISVDDNFVITEHGYDVLSYKITDYVSKSSFDSLSATVAKKANSSDVYTKTETDSAISALQSEIDGTGKYDTIIDYTYTGDEAATELNILLTVEQLQKIKKYEKFFCYVKYNVSATTGTTSFWATATLNLCTKGTTALLSYGGIFMRAANTMQKITADNTPITWIATTEKVRLPDSDICVTNVLDYGGTQYNLFNISTLTGGSSRLISPVLYKHSETEYDWVMQLKSPTTMPFMHGMKFIMWGK